ncbi:MAG: hypothetical protein NZ473_02820 [Candidatus Kapabacteria bacterium]|nr:hypothetical protein [Candidatus Kapabacteria bacterium]MCS7169988.1 hypothetical protein [Candidatus Kapabacteria bacterium]MDW7996265.1 hypothetical protein [Bacteroidota bacterium]MDW8225541.1 hypothetical protein [Bacteroidota bacterium]
MAKGGSARSARSSVQKPRWSFPLQRRNWLVIGAGIGLMCIGYLLLAVGIFTRYDHPLAIVVAPIVLVIAYLVVIPYGLLKRWSPPDSSGTSQ